MPSPNNPPFCNTPPLPSSGAACSTHPRDLFWVCKWCVVLAPVVCVCTVQVEKQLKRRGIVYRVRKGQFYFITPVLSFRIFHPSFHSLHLTFTLYLYLGGSCCCWAYTQPTRETFFFIDTVTRNRRTSFSEKRCTPNASHRKSFSAH